MAQAKQETQKAATESGVTAAQQKHMKALPSTSARIRYLAEQGYSRSESAKILGIRYQHVRNVLVTPLVGPREKKSS